VNERTEPELSQLLGLPVRHRETGDELSAVARALQIGGFVRDSKKSLKQAAPSPHLETPTPPIKSRKSQKPFRLHSETNHSRIIHPSHHSLRGVGASIEDCGGLNRERLHLFCGDESASVRFASDGSEEGV